MARVETPSGDVIETTSPVALNYYQREPGYKILAGSDSDTGPVRPAVSALKQDWVDYALAVDPDNAEWINDSSTTKDELIGSYGGE